MAYMRQSQSNTTTQPKSDSLKSTLQHGLRETVPKQHYNTTYLRETVSNQHYNTAYIIIIMIIIIISGFGIYGAAVVDGVDAGSGTLYMPVPPKTPSAKNSHDLVYFQFLVKHSRGNIIFQLCTADPPDLRVAHVK